MPGSIPTLPVSGFIVYLVVKAPALLIFISWFTKVFLIFFEYYENIKPKEMNILTDAHHVKEIC